MIASNIESRGELLGISEAALCCDWIVFWTSCDEISASNIESLGEAGAFSGAAGVASGVDVVLSTVFVGNSGRSSRPNINVDLGFWGLFCVGFSCCSCFSFSASAACWILEIMKGLKAAVSFPETSICMAGRSVEVEASTSAAAGVDCGSVLLGASAAKSSVVLPFSGGCVSAVSRLGGGAWVSEVSRPKELDCFSATACAIAACISGPISAVLRLSVGGSVFGVLGSKEGAGVVAVTRPDDMGGSIPIKEVLRSA